MIKLEIEQREDGKFVGGVDAELGKDGAIKLTTYGRMSDETATHRLSREDAVRLRDFLTLHTPDSATVR